ncbi:MAG: hypothetical protein COX19_04405 [Desulfobacterales bacterium CG23_combo_of_CG06-09_8_20_14_all_51_8]|nr:MAG: hypothetical protein COX19_04405 [Desulfobacterales bacterium CG23_combo_of_CG06-09_8_20_14_all_51_8]
MARKSTKILIKKIVTDQRYYPRFEVDQERVKEFVEAMEYGEHFSPIKVVRDPKTGLYILLDGKHRLEGYILRGEVEILADILFIPEEHWLMASARFNSKSSKPLTANETKKIIIFTWNTGIKDTDEIAREMGCTVRYVEMVIKPVRDEERLKRKEVISELNEQGMSQREIASKLCLSVGYINKALKLNDDDSGKETLQNPKREFSEIPGESSDAGQVFTKRSNFVLETPCENNNISELDHSTEKSDQNLTAEAPITSPERELETPAVTDEVFTKRSDFVLRTPDENYNISELETKPQKSTPDSPKIHPETSKPAGSTPGNDSQNKKPGLPQKTSPYPTYIDQIDFYHELSTQGQHAIRAMELAKKYKVDIVDIAKEIDEPLLWTKKVLVAAIALSLMNGDKLNDASSVETMIGIDLDIARAIQAMLPFHTMLCPVAPEMEQWIKDNLSSQDLDMILELVDVDKKDLPYLLKGEAPPPPKKNCFEELPTDYREQLQAYIAVLREIRDHVKNKMFNEDSAKQLMVHLNKNVTVINEIVDGLREEKLL